MLIRPGASCTSYASLNRVFEEISGLGALALLEVLAQLLLVSTGSNASKLRHRFALGKVFVAQLVSLAVDLLGGSTSLRCTLNWAVFVPWGPSLPLNLLAG